MSDVAGDCRRRKEQSEKRQRADPEPGPTGKRPRQACRHRLVVPRRDTLDLPSKGEKFDLIRGISGRRDGPTKRTAN